MPNDLQLVLPEVVIPGQRLGRVIHHDPRSLRFLVQPRGVPQTKMWDRIVPILDQGDLGSCTGNATVGALGTTGLYEHLDEPQQEGLNETEAVDLYSMATRYDEFTGTYPPQDTGSSGLGAAKAAKAQGYISGYQHITSVAAAQTAIQAGPFITGTNWYQGMDDPGPAGLVKVTGANRGGHEYQCYGYDAPTDTWHFCNSWSTSWGDAGRFHMSGPDFARLLREEGDATTLVPLTQPAPTPTPQPPAPAPARAPFPRDTWERWKAHPNSLMRRDALVRDVDTWLLSQ